MAITLEKLSFSYIFLAEQHKNILITSLTADSRYAESGSLFCALKGSQENAAVYIFSAIEKGAAAVFIESSFSALSEAERLQIQKKNLAVYHFPQLSRFLGYLAAYFYQYPSETLSVIGITGTNGKSSTAYSIASALSLKKKSAFIGTLGIGYPLDLEKTSHTTPDPIRLQAILAQFKQDFTDDVAMEVSSHSLAQRRVTATCFLGAIFTNLSHDHLDYHHTMEAYFTEKKKLFFKPGLKYRIMNIDDSRGYALYQIFKRLPGTYALTLNQKTVRSDQMLSVDNIQYHQKGMLFTLQTPWGTASQVQSQLFGKYNLYNLLNTAAILGLKGYSYEAIIHILSQLTAVSGRMELITFHQQNSPVFIDYAHTPDALEQSLQALQLHGFKAVTCVFGCGGNRDVEKRSKMGGIAEKYASKIILTNDNPRNEAPEVIIQQILSGMTRTNSIQIILDRKKAIEKALEEQELGEAVLIAGKGHETSQIMNMQSLPFSDHAVVKLKLKL